MTGHIVMERTAVVMPTIAAERAKDMDRVQDRETRRSYAPRSVRRRLSRFAMIDAERDGSGAGIGCRARPTLIIMATMRPRGMRPRAGRLRR
ncbi:hypothetical protein WK02_23190 [Burkholderia cepacia]|nr:hypothetical protein WJ46_05360 [Burkholderia cepacia]KVQ27591.1 hypothetical protein WK02_23190 [Burkholderia cepacia]